MIRERGTARLLRGQLCSTRQIVSCPMTMPGPQQLPRLPWTCACQVLPSFRSLGTSKTRSGRACLIISPVTLHAVGPWPTRLPGPLSGLKTGRRRVVSMTVGQAGALPVDRYLRNLRAHFVGLTDGAVADYIPPLAAVDPNRFAICIATVDGQIYEVGDSGVEFTIQSISKPFTYGMALEDRGVAAVLSRIGVEPSGDAFNEISLDGKGRPFNPMINAGAIMASSLIDGDDPLERLLARYATWAGRGLKVDQAVYQAERATGHRNRAIGHMLRAVGTLEGDAERALDLYFQQCSVLVTNRDLAVMAATLAARGLNPLTRQSALPDDLVDHVLSLMTTCGMYDAAGEWLVDVGIPAKSGVGGGIIGVLPGQLGISVFSPRLDSVGNSVRGVAVFRQLSADLRLHFLNVGRSSSATQSMTYALADVPSTRFRGAQERAALDARAHATLVFQLSGDVLFAGAEAITRKALDSPHQFVLLDLHRVGILDPAAARVLAELARQLSEAGGALILAGAHDVTVTAIGARAFADVDAAKEWCEEQILVRGGRRADPAAIDLADHPLCAGMSASDVLHLQSLATLLEFNPGQTLVATGDPAAEVFALTSGEVDVSITTTGGDRRRLATLAAGSIFGEAAMTGQARRSADVVASTAGQCFVLSTTAINAAPAELRAAVLASVLDFAHRALARSTRAIAALSR